MRALVIIGLIIALFACADPAGVEPVVWETRFDTGGTQGWSALLSDYQPEIEDRIGFVGRIETIPAPPEGRVGFRLRAANHPDDIFMFVTRRVGGLEPGATYAVRFRAEFATPYGRSCAGAGGPPGEAIWLKAGASTTEPRPFLHDGRYRLDIDKGEQIEEGAAARILDDAAHDHASCESSAFFLKTAGENAQPVLADADDQGNLWLFFGFESGYEGLNDLYLVSVRATATPL